MALVDQVDLMDLEDLVEKHLQEDLGSLVGLEDQEVLGVLEDLVAQEA